MFFDRKTHRTGFIQILPLVLLAVFAITTLVIANRVQTQQEEIRSKAYFQSPTGQRFIGPTSTPAPKPATPAPVTHPDFGPKPAAPKPATTAAPPPKPIKTPAPAVPTPVTHPDFGPKPAAPKPATTAAPQPQGEHGRGTATTPAPAQTAAPAAPKQTTCTFGPVSCGPGYNRVCTNPPFWSCVPAAPKPVAPGAAAAATAANAAKTVACIASKCANGPLCREALACFGRPPASTPTLPPTACGGTPPSCSSDTPVPVCDSKSYLWTCVPAPQGQKIIRYSYDAVNKGCKEDANGIFLNLSECKQMAGAATDEQKYNNCLQGAQKQVCENLLSTETLDTFDPNNPKCVKKLYGVSPETCQKQLTAYQLKQTAAQGAGQALPAVSCTKEQSEAGTCNEKRERCKKLSQTIGPNKTPTFVYRFESDASCAATVPVSTPSVSPLAFCPEGLNCSRGVLIGSMRCRKPGDDSYIPYCCSKGQVILQGKCVTPQPTPVALTTPATQPQGAGAACASGWQCGNTCASAKDVSDFTALYCDPKSQWLYEAGNALGVPCGGGASRRRIEGCKPIAVGCPDTTRITVLNQGGRCAFAGEYDCCRFCPSGTTAGTGDNAGICMPVSFAEGSTAARDACKGRGSGDCSSNGNLCAMFRGIVYETAQKCPSSALCAENYCAGTCRTREWNGKAYPFCDNVGVIERDFYLIKPGEQCPMGVRTCSCRNSEVPEGQICKISSTTGTSITDICQKACGANECSQNGGKITCLIGPKGILGRWDKYQLNPGERCPIDARREDCFCAGSLQPDGTCVTASFLANAPSCTNSIKLGGATCQGSYTNVVQFCTNPSIDGPSQYTYTACGFIEECKGGLCVPSSDAPDVTKRIVMNAQDAKDMSTKLCGKGYQWVLAPGTTRSDAPGAGNAGHCESTMGSISDGYIGKVTYQREKRICIRTCGDVDGCRCSPLDCDGRTYTKFGENCGGGKDGLQQWVDRTNAIFNSSASTGDKLNAGVWQFVDLFTFGTLASGNQAKLSHEQCQREIATGKRDPNDNCLKEALDTATNIGFAALSGADMITGIWKGFAGLVGRGVKEGIVVSDIGLAAELRGVEAGTVVELGKTKYLVNFDSEGRQVLTKLGEADKVPKGSFKVAVEDGAPCALPISFIAQTLSLESSGEIDVLGISSVLSLKPCVGGGVSTRPVEPVAAPKDFTGNPAGAREYYEGKFGPRISSGSYGSVYRSPSGDTLTKVFHASDVPAVNAANEAQLDFLIKADGAGGLPKVTKLIIDPSGKTIGFEMTAIPGVPLIKVARKGLTSTQIAQFEADLNAMPGAHTDLILNGTPNLDNIIVQPNGRLTPIDPAGQASQIGKIYDSVYKAQETKDIINFLKKFCTDCR